MKFWNAFAFFLIGMVLGVWTFQILLLVGYPDFDNMEWGRRYELTEVFPKEIQDPGDLNE
jgi:hypothetical protein